MTRPSKLGLISAGTLTALAAMATGLVASAQTAQLDTNLTVNGQGSTFMSNFVELCKADVKNALNINIGYSPTGSGAGRSGFISGNVDWAGSDVPFTASELQNLRNKPFRYIPITIGGIAVIYKLPGVNDLRLSGPTLGKIFSGRRRAGTTRRSPRTTLASRCPTRRSRWSCARTPRARRTCSATTCPWPPRAPGGPACRTPSPFPRQRHRPARLGRRDELRPGRPG